jgi:hypothetical protein
MVVGPLGERGVSMTNFLHQKNAEKGSSPHKKPTDFSLNSFLACPLCHGAVDFIAEGVLCLVCHLDFNKNQEVLPFIVRELYPSNDAYHRALSTTDFLGKGWEKQLEETDHKVLFKKNAADLKRHAIAEWAFHQKHCALIGSEISTDSFLENVGLNIGCGSGTERLLLSHLGVHCLCICAQKKDQWKSFEKGKLRGRHGL